MTTHYTRFDSPLGQLLITSCRGAITGLAMAGQKHAVAIQPDWHRDDTRHQAAREQLQAYFAGKLRTFELPLAPAGTPFQCRVWQALREIPFGRTSSYAELARHIGQAGAARAVGTANGRNPITIIIPCHRVLGADGRIAGYSGGIDRKRWLLTHEDALPGSRQ